MSDTSGDLIIDESYDGSYVVYQDPADVNVDPNAPSSKLIQKIFWYQ